MKYNRLKYIWSVLVGAMMIVSSAHASTSIGTVGLSVSLMADCTLSLTTLNFSTSSALFNANQDTTSTLFVACTNGTAYNLGLDSGLYSGATTSTRRMQTTDGTSSIAYSLSMDSARSVNWGNNIGVDTSAGVGTGKLQSVSVYSRIASGQTAVTGNYSDTITATISY